MKTIAIIAATLALAATATASTARENAHKCAATCVVNFGGNMHEDQFCIDYRGNGTLLVWRDNDTECR